MRKTFIISALLFAMIVIASFTRDKELTPKQLRKIYSGPSNQWPRPFVDEGVEWKELGVLPESPLTPYLDSLKPLVELGKVLFFDTRVSGSGTISCATCHQPELSWADGKPRSLGHEGTVNRRNAPSLHNVWFYKKLFHDGRSHSLEDQAFAPINSESEMHGDMRELPRQLRKIKGYDPLFKAAFGDNSIDPDRIATALATFQRTIVSRKSRFDEFLLGNKNALSNAELKGLHLFRTKARCINCHHGALLTDNQFHNLGVDDVDPGKPDPGLYHVTHKEEDRGKFKTPSLRDVMNTGPWMHNGSEDDINNILVLYQKGPGARGSDKLIRHLAINSNELNHLKAFLESISAPPLEFAKPRLPE